MAKKGNHKVLLGTLLFSAATFGTTTLANADEISSKEINRAKDDVQEDNKDTIITVGKKSTTMADEQSEGDRVVDEKLSTEVSTVNSESTDYTDESSGVNEENTADNTTSNTLTNEKQEETQLNESQEMNSIDKTNQNEEGEHSKVEDASDESHSDELGKTDIDNTTSNDSDKNESKEDNKEITESTGQTPDNTHNETEQGTSETVEEVENKKPTKDETQSTTVNKTDKPKVEKDEKNSSTSNKKTDTVKKPNVTKKEEQKKQIQTQYKPSKPQTVKTKTVFERAMEDPTKLTQKEIDSLTDDELMELAASGKIYDKRFMETLAVRQSYSRTGNAGEAFIKKWGEAARKVAQKYNVYASVMMAQAMLESGYGQSELASKHNNLFGIKAGPGYTGKKVLYWTKEFINGQWYTVQDYFRHYDDLESSFIDNASIIRNGTSWDHSYYKGAWKENCNSYRDATQWLQGRYATDPTYASKLNRIIEQYNLTRFDTPSSSTNRPSNTPTSGTVYYTVQRGDTLGKIANQYNTTANKIAKDNNIKDANKIYVGQKLTIHLGNGSQSSKPSKPATSKPSQTTENKTVYYTVKSGDTLSKIASNHKVTVDHIVKENKLKDANKIYVGQKLIIQRGTQANKPANPSKPNKPSTSKPSQTTENKTIYYTVKSGDTLGKIANQYNTTANKIAKDNNIKDANKIYVGQKLAINKGTTTSTNKPTTPSRPNTTTTTQTVYYTVKQGDTVSKIANKYNTTTNKIVKDNNLKNPNVIYVGQKLKVGTKKVTTNNTVSHSSASSSHRSYTVKSGDNLYEIARRNGTTVSALMKKNNIKDPSVIYVGQHINL